MRKLLILGAVLLILAGALFVAASNLNRYLAENREWLAEQASSALGRSVAFDEIGVSLRGGLGALRGGAYRDRRARDQHHQEPKRFQLRFARAHCG